MCENTSRKKQIAGKKLWIGTDSKRFTNDNLMINTNYKANSYTNLKQELAVGLSPFESLCCHQTAVLRVATFPFSFPHHLPFFYSVI